MALNDGAAITWLGHACFRITSQEGKVILTDPFLVENPATPSDMKTQERVDLILPSHGHSDNFADTVDIAKSTDAKVACIFEVAQWLGKQGVQNVVAMNFGGSAEVDGIRVTMVPAWHSSTLQDANGDLIAGGMACGFIIRLEDGFTIYFSGDTGVFLDMQLIGRLYQPQIAILPIGDLFTMGPMEASEAIRLLGVKRVIPMHYGTFPILTGTPAELRERTADVDGLEIVDLEPGNSVPPLVKAPQQYP